MKQVKSTVKTEIECQTKQCTIISNLLPLTLFFFNSNFWWRQLVAGRSLKFAPFRGDFGWTLLPKECYGSWLSGRGSSTQPSNWEADTLPLSECRPKHWYCARKDSVRDIGVARRGGYRAMARPTIRPGLAGTVPVSKMSRNCTSVKFSKWTPAWWRSVVK